MLLTGLCPWDTQYLTEHPVLSICFHDTDVISHHFYLIYFSGPDLASTELDDSHADLNIRHLCLLYQKN